MTSEILAKLQREYLIHSEKKAAIQIAAKFRIFRSELIKFMLANSARISAKDYLFLRIFLNKFSAFFDNLVLPLDRIVSQSQTRVIGYAAESLQNFFPEIKTSIFRTDTEAIEKLIGRTQTGTSLDKFFLNIKLEIAEIAKKEFIEGFASGDGAEAIASRLNKVSDIGLSRAMTISRSSTNYAFREATRENYSKINSVIGYRWTANKDFRTCLYCIARDGQIFKTSQKMPVHLNCRCVMLPEFKNGSGQVKETAAQWFDKLETGVKREILGKKAFEFYDKNLIGLKDFIGTRKYEGEIFGYRKSLKEILNDKNINETFLQ